MHSSVSEWNGQTRWRESGPKSRSGGSPVKRPRPASGRRNGSGGRGPGDDRLAEVTELLADCLLRRLPLCYCAIYLYDRNRANLVEVAARGDGFAPPLDGVIPLESGTSLPDLGLDQGRPGGWFALPLWDGRVTVGAVFARLNPGALPTPATLECGRIIAQSWALTLSYVLEDRSVSVEVGGRPRMFWCSRDAGYTANPYLARYLESALVRTCPDGPVVVATVRLRHPSDRVCRLPARGVPLRAGAPGPGQIAGRAFGLPGSSQAALVWLRVDVRAVREILRAAAGGRIGLDGLTGSASHGAAGPAARLDAVGLAVYPDDAGSPGELLAAADDFFDLQVYLLSLRAYNHDGGRDTVPERTGGTTGRVMDRRVLDREIDRQKQVLVQAIQSGLGFQDSQVRQISELLDRLIVVRQRHMGHRGAVP